MESFRNSSPREVGGAQQPPVSVTTSSSVEVLK